MIREAPIPRAPSVMNMLISRCAFRAAVVTLAVSASCTTGPHIVPTYPSATSVSTTPAVPPTAATPAAPTTPSAPFVTRVDLTGNVSLTTVGETSQLTATATLSDGTAKDVTSDLNAKWTSSDPSVITVSSSGLLTVVALGNSTVIVSYQTKTSVKTVTATPPGTFVIAGWVREPGESGVPGVRVTDTASRRVVQTNQNGNYSVAQLAGGQAHLRFDKDGYEPVEHDATPGDAEVAIQKIIRLVAGETVTPLKLAPHDLSYTIGTDRCYPCRLVRVMVPIAGTLHVTVTWTEPRATLNLWAGGQFFAGASRQLTADVPAGTPGEVIMYLGTILPAGTSGGVYVPFTIATAPMGS
jgi:hypothetical protein